MSGLSRTPGKRVWVNSPTRVRIPPSPPVPSVLTRPRAHRLQGAIDPLSGELFLQGVLPQPLAKRSEIDEVDRLVLVEAGKHERGLARRGIDVRLEALR